MSGFSSAPPLVLVRHPCAATCTAPSVLHTPPCPRRADDLAVAPHGAASASSLSAPPTAAVPLHTRTVPRPHLAALLRQVLLLHRPCLLALVAPGSATFTSVLRRTMHAGHCSLLRMHAHHRAAAAPYAPLPTPLDSVVPCRAGLWLAALLLVQHHVLPPSSSLKCSVVHACKKELHEWDAHVMGVAMG